MLNTPCKQIQLLSIIKTLNCPRVRGISPVGKKKVYGGNDLPNSQVLSSEWKTERVREDASGDREDGEEDDDELLCVIGESEGDCLTRLAKISGELIHRQGAAYWKERLVIFKEDRVGGRVLLLRYSTSLLLRILFTCNELQFYAVLLHLLSLLFQVTFFT